MELKTINKIIAILIILANFYFVPASYTTIQDGGGAMGLGIIILPILFSINLLIIPALLTFVRKFSDSLPLFVVLILGFLWILFWLHLLS